jgi:hypothetical protein
VPDSIGMVHQSSSNVCDPLLNELSNHFAAKNQLVVQDC